MVVGVELGIAGRFVVSSGFTWRRLNRLLLKKEKENKKPNFIAFGAVVLKLGTIRMLHTVSRRSVLRCIRTGIEVSTFNCSVPIRRHYADKKSSSESKPKIDVQDSGASRKPTTPPALPSDQTSHQTREDITLERLSQQNGKLEREAFERDPKVKALKIAQHEDAGALVDGVPFSRRSGENEGILGEMEIRHVADGSLGYQEMVKESEDGNFSLAGKLEVPLGVINGDGKKPINVNESFKDNDERLPVGQPLRSNDNSTATAQTKANTDTSDSNKKSILGLFGGPSRRAHKAEKSAPEPFNPLAAHGLEEGGVDLSAWETTHRGHEELDDNIDPKDWAESNSVSTQLEGLHRQPSSHPAVPSHAEVLREFMEITQSPPNRKEAPETSNPVDKPYSISQESPPSPWDYFYPPAPAPQSLESALREHWEERNKDILARRRKGDVYDPFAKKERIPKWPWLYNRDELVEKCTRLIMRHGQKATAEKIMQEMFLRLLERYPRRHPVTVLAEAIDRNAPLLICKNNREIAKITVVPIPLFEKQRVRLGWMSMVRVAQSAKAKDRGLTTFGERLAGEVIKVMEGRGSGLPFRIAEHKKGMLNKLNVKLPANAKNDT